jgi:hypothetical protein
MLVLGERGLVDVGNVIKCEVELVGRKTSQSRELEEGIYISKTSVPGWPKYQSLVTLLPRGGKEFPVPALEGAERGTQEVYNTMQVITLIGPVPHAT